MQKKEVPKKIIELRVGRVYLITPDPIPGYPKKSRPAIYFGKKMIGNGYRYLFMQIGSTKITHYKISKLNNELDDLWKQMKGKSYIHIDISKYEYFRVVNHPFIVDRKYIQMDIKSIEKVKEVYLERIKELELIRLKKAKVYAIKGEFKDAKRQLNLLKQIMPEKHSKLHPESLIKKWKRAFESL